MILETLKKTLAAMMIVTLTLYVLTQSDYLKNVDSTVEYSEVGCILFTVCHYTWPMSQ